MDELKNVRNTIQMAMGNLADARSMIERYKKSEKNNNPNENFELMNTLEYLRCLCTDFGYKLSDGIGYLEEYFTD